MKGCDGPNADLVVPGSGNDRRRGGQIPPSTVVGQSRFGAATQSVIAAHDTSESGQVADHAAYTSF